MDKPEFTAYEMNQLISLARTSNHYKSILELIKDNSNCTIPQVKLLWAVKNELKEE